MRMVWISKPQLRKTLMGFLLDPMGLLAVMAVKTLSRWKIKAWLMEGSY
jgi:hypothetical protein